MPGRTRGRMFDIRPEDGIEDTGTGAYPGYPGYGDSDVDDFDDYADHYAAQDARRGAPPANGVAPRNGSGPGAPNGRPPAPGRNGSAPATGSRPVPPGPRTGGAVPAPAGPAAATTAVRAVGRDTTGRAPAPGASGRLPAPAPAGYDDRVAPDGRWDDEEPPLLSHRVEDDELAYARDRTPQGFDGGDPDDPSWGRRPSRPAGDDLDDEHDAEYVGDHDAEYDDEAEYDAEYDEDEYGVGDAPLSVPPPGSGGRPLGPADVEELDPSMTDALARVDLGALQVPVPYGAELKLEPAGAERPQAVHLLLAEGRIAVSALAAPRSSGLWADLSAEIEQSLRTGGARVRNARGDWGRELHARTENAASVFVGCDGPRWMVYGVATASLETVEALDVELRRVLRGIIVVRGKSPYPPRTVLPLELPEHLRERQPEAAPQKPSITVSVPAPAGETGATPAPSGPTTGARPVPAAASAEPATPVEPARPARPRRTAPAAASASGVPAARPPAGPVGPRPSTDDADSRTRALPQVRRPAAAAPADPAAARTPLAPDVRTDESPAERTALTDGPLVAPGPEARPGRRRGRPARPDRTGANRLGGAPAGATTSAATPSAATPLAAPQPGGIPGSATPTGAIPTAGGVAPAAGPGRAGPDTGVGPLPGRGSIHAPAPLHAPAPMHAPDPAPSAVAPLRAPEPESAEPPARRDPAVTALSAADLLAGVEDDRSATPLTGFGRGASAGDILDRSTPVPASALDPGTVLGGPALGDTALGGPALGDTALGGPALGDTALDGTAFDGRTALDPGTAPDGSADTAADGSVDAADGAAHGRDPFGTPTASGATAGSTRPGTGGAARRSRRDRAADAARVDAADLLAARTRDTPAGPPEPASPPTGAIEDIPLSDVPLMEATLDRLPAPTEPAAPASTRRRRGARPTADAPGHTAPTDPTPDDDGWLSAEIAASRRSGRHGAGAGTSVADLLAAVALDAPAGGGRRREPGDAPSTGSGTAGSDTAGPAPTGSTSRGVDHDPAPAAYPASPGPGGDDLFRAAADADRPWHGGGPTSADEARSALQDLLRSASADRGPHADGPGADRTNGHGGVTGLADYRASRAAAGRAAARTDDPAPADPARTAGERTDGTDDTEDASGGLDAGRAAGGSGLTGQWPSGRRAGGTGPRDLGRHRRD
ncbi:MULTISPECIES: DUF3710 domain-containing protein [unclassified Pseudonocardia]|uniref:DUF3710 domain-containing protein n=1 Tax=unclassified Pseudonocardia TaxID=2619320 RepID=UPI000AB11ACC|nr:MULTISPECIES: DUF3710 domain-containing protein [unclassified Pseudonocardia]